MVSTSGKSALACALLSACAVTYIHAQNSTDAVPPVIDVHVHAIDESWPGGPTCPNQAKFLASDPATKESPIGWSQEECTPSFIHRPRASTSWTRLPR